MRSLRWVSFPVLAVMLAASPAAARSGDPRVVQGVLAWAAGTEGTPFVVVRADDGRHYVADLSGAQRRGGAVNVGDRISVAGVEGPQPWQLSALVVGSGDSAIAALTPSSDSPAASPAMPPQAPSESRAWRQIRGTVDAVTDATLRIRQLDGRQVTVDLSRLGRGAGTTLRPGDRATVFVVAEDGQRLVAVGFVQTQSTEGSASPRPRR